MEKIQFDNGVREFRINGGGVLRFNPGDPNLMARFLEAAEKIAQLEQELVDSPQSPEEAVALLVRLDEKIKSLLGWVFACQDFHQVVGGVNLLALGANGQRIVTNLFQALEPVLSQGVKAQTQQAVEKAKRRRSAHE